MSPIDANPAPAATGNQAFIFRPSGGFISAAGEVRVVTSGSDTHVYVDIDDDAAVEMLIVVKGVTGLTAADFIL